MSNKTKRDGEDVTGERSLKRVKPNLPPGKNDGELDRQNLPSPYSSHHSDSHRRSSSHSSDSKGSIFDKASYPSVDTQAASPNSTTSPPPSDSSESCTSGDPPMAASISESNLEILKKMLQLKHHFDPVIYAEVYCVIPDLFPESGWTPVSEFAMFAPHYNWAVRSRDATKMWDEVLQQYDKPPSIDVYEFNEERNELGGFHLPQTLSIKLDLCDISTRDIEQYTKEQTSTKINPSLFSLQFRPQKDYEIFKKFLHEKIKKLDVHPVDSPFYLANRIDISSYLRDADPTEHGIDRIKFPTSTEHDGMSFAVHVFPQLGELSSHLESPFSTETPHLFLELDIKDENQNFERINDRHLWVGEVAIGLFYLATADLHYRYDVGIQFQSIPIFIRTWKGPDYRLVMIQLDLKTRKLSIHKTSFGNGFRYDSPSSHDFVDMDLWWVTANILPIPVTTADRFPKRDIEMDKLLLAMKIPDIEVEEFFEEPERYRELYESLQFPKSGIRYGFRHHVVLRPVMKDWFFNLTEPTGRFYTKDRKQPAKTIEFNKAYWYNNHHDW